MKTHAITTLLALVTCAAFAQSPDLTLVRDKNWLVIQGPHLPKGEKGIGRDHNAGGFTVWMAGGGVMDRSQFKL